MFMNLSHWSVFALFVRVSFNKNLTIIYFIYKLLFIHLRIHIIPLTLIIIYNNLWSSIWVNSQIFFTPISSLSHYCFWELRSLIRWTPINNLNAATILRTIIPLRSISFNSFYKVLTRTIRPHFDYSSYWL
jgi:hypothetical protein